MDRVANQLDNLAPLHTTVFMRVSGFSSEESRSLWWYVHDAGHWRCGTGYHVAPRTYHGHLIMFMVAGTGVGVYRDQNWRAGKGDAVLMDLHHRHSYASDDANPWEMFWVIMDGPGVGQVFRALTQGAGSCVIPFASEERMRTDFAALFQLLQEHPSGAEPWVWRRMRGLIANIAEGLRRVRGDSAASIGGLPEGIAPAIRFLQQEHPRAIT